MSPIAEAAVHRDAAICPQLENKPKLPLGRADRPPEFIAAARFCCRLVSTSDLSFLVCSIAAERLCAPAHIKCGSANSTWEEIMGHLILQGDNTIYNGFALLGETSLAMTLIDTGTGGFDTRLPGFERDDIREYRQCWATSGFNKALSAGGDDQ